MTLGVLADVVDPPLVPGSPEWRAELTASKVSAILGLSPWTSRFTIWHDMAGFIPHEDGEMTKNQARGHYLEDAVARWFGDEHGLHIRPGRCWRSQRHPWMVATPDRLAHATRYSKRALATVEIKTSGNDEEWGTDGSDEIPPHYRVQIVWQLDTLGLPTGYLAVLLPRLNFRSYTIRHDPEEAEWVRKEVLTFLNTLPGRPDEQVPDIDESDSTYESLRVMHAGIEDREVTIDLQTARRFIGVLDDEKSIKAAAVGAKSEMAALMGTAKRAVVDLGGDKPLVVATRMCKGEGNPYVAAGRSQAMRELLGV